MAFEPLSYGNRWYDRIVGRRLRVKEFALVLAVVGTLAIVWQVF